MVGQQVENEINKRITQVNIHHHIQQEFCANKRVEEVSREFSVLFDGAHIQGLRALMKLHAVYNKQARVEDMISTYPNIEVNGVNQRAQGQEPDRSGALGSVK